MNILITGAGGFIGSHLYNCLKNEHEVYRVFSHKYKSTSQKTFCIDLTNTMEVEELIEHLSKEKKIDVVLHLASKLVSINHSNDVSILFDNIRITNSIVDLIIKIKPKKLINFSTIGVYPNISGTFNEESRISTAENYECIYGLSKICSENLFSYQIKENTQVVHLRLSQVYGDGMRKDRIISIMKDELFNTNCINVHGNGERVSNFISIEKLLSIINVFLLRKVNGVYNIGDENKTYLDLAIELIKKYGNNSSKIEKIEKGSRSKFYLDISKLNNFLQMKQLN
jgi:nucleoside-diphosphate-sugar epimerase